MGAFQHFLLYLFLDVLFTWFLSHYA